MNRVVGTAAGGILPRRRHALDDPLVRCVRERARQAGLRDVLLRLQGVRE